MTTSKRFVSTLLIGIALMLSFGCGSQPEPPASNSEQLEPTPKPSPTPQSVAPTKIIMPKFDEIIDAGAGGAGGSSAECLFNHNVLINILKAQRDIYYFSAGESVLLCFDLDGFNPNLPFDLRLSRSGEPDFWLRNVALDLEKGVITAEDYPGEEYGFDVGISERYTITGALNLWWNRMGVEGIWDVALIQEDFKVYGEYHLDEDHAAITVTDKNNTEGLLPYDYWLESGKITALGGNYSPNIPVYLLIYQHNPEVGGDAAYELLFSQIVISDDEGNFTVTLENELENGNYIIQGRTLPSNSGALNGFAEDSFYVGVGYTMP